MKIFIIIHISILVIISFLLQSMRNRNKTWEGFICPPPPPLHLIRVKLLLRRFGAISYIESGPQKFIFHSNMFLNLFHIRLG